MSAATRRNAALASHVDGKAVKSCTMLAAQASGSTVVTIEGLANGAELHPVQAAFKEHHGLQCGFCTPGMIMAATDMIRRHPKASTKSYRARRTRRQYLPLHRLPQHRQGDPGRFGENHVEGEGQGQGRLELTVSQNRAAAARKRSPTE
jgi:hypothetical protein